MAVLIVMPDRSADAARLAADMRDIERNIDVRIWPDSGDHDDIEMVVSWKHPPGLLGKYRNLRLVASFGAGVEHLLGDPGLPPDVPIVRTVDDTLINGMAEYVVLAVGDWRRGWSAYRRNQDGARWEPRKYPFGCSALVMGLGRLGSAVAAALEAVGHTVVGWSRTGRGLADGRVLISGRQDLERVLGESDVVVCVLPLTDETEGILDRDFFRHMREGSLLINVARGRHLVEEDLLDALAAGRPGHAVLDVFRREPLPPGHPFWAHPGVTVTPHVAALTDPKGAAARVIENWLRNRRGEGLLDVVDRSRGY